MKFSFHRTWQNFCIRKDTIVLFCDFGKVLINCERQLEAVNDMLGSHVPLHTHQLDLNLPSVHLAILRSNHLCGLGVQPLCVCYGNGGVASKLSLLFSLPFLCSGYCLKERRLRNVDSLQGFLMTISAKYFLKTKTAFEKMLCITVFLLLNPFPPVAPINYITCNYLKKKKLVALKISTNQKYIYSLIKTMHIINLYITNLNIRPFLH